MVDKGLLPTGVRDVLPTDAAFEAEVEDRLMACLARNGFERVKPPLIEFEDSLLAGSGKAVADQSFRIMDPITQKMMAVRPDMTVQVGRIAASRLSKSARPLRLSYAGQVLRVRGSQLRPERQFTQVGAEVIGSQDSHADAEAIIVAAQGLRELGVKGLSVDLGLPRLVPEICNSLEMDDTARAGLREAFDRKDAAYINALPEPARGIFATLLEAIGPSARAMAKLDALELTGPAADQRALLAETLRLVRAQLPDLALTIDAVENRGFEYHTGVTFTFFSRVSKSELGRGGRYQGWGDAPATGFTLFLNVLLKILENTKTPRRILVAAGTSEADILALQADGWQTLRAFDNSELDAMARAQACSHILREHADGPSALD